MLLAVIACFGPLWLPFLALTAEILSHARSGKDNDKFFITIFNNITETSDRMKKMLNPNRGTYLTP